jgi:hypothetical protein
VTLRRLFHRHAFVTLQETERWDGAPLVVRQCNGCGSLERIVYGPSYH